MFDNQQFWAIFTFILGGIGVITLVVLGLVKRKTTYTVFCKQKYTEWLQNQTYNIAAQKELYEIYSSPKHWCNDLNGARVKRGKIKGRPIFREWTREVPKTVKEKGQK